MKKKTNASADAERFSPLSEPQNATIPVDAKPGDTEPKQSGSDTGPVSVPTSDTPHATVEEKGTEAAAEKPEGKSAPAPPEHEERFLRLLADFDNYRKRVARERAELYHRAREDVIREFLPLLDHLEMTIQHAHDSETAGPLADAVRIVAQQMKGILKRLGVSRLDVLGAPFDPQRHCAIGVEITSEQPENTVVRQGRPGYAIDGRVLRPAEVVVARAPEATSNETLPRPETIPPEEGEAQRG